MKSHQRLSIVILATLFMILGFGAPLPAAQAKGSCTALFALKAPQPSNFKTSTEQKNASPVSPTASESKTSLSQAFDDLGTMSNLASWAPWRDVVRQLDKDLENPYSLAWDLHEVSKRLGSDAVTELKTLLKIALKDPSPERNKAFDEWTRTEAHALLLYELINQRGLEEYSDTLEYLLTNNLYFNDTHPVRGPPGFEKVGLVTFSFEKEGTKPEITWMYRPPGYDDVTWLKLSDQNRIEVLRNAVKDNLKEFLPADKISPTDLKPSFLGGYSEELSNAEHQGWGWEVSHKKYEISRYRAMHEVRQLAQTLKETHSFHFHMVFELPKNYVNYPSFIRWFKIMNDYLYLRGVEEGLHGNYLTNVLNLKEDLSLIDRLRDKLRDRFTQKPATTLVESQEALTRIGNKFFSAGLRGGGMYGPASYDGNMKIGIELRDTTRNLDFLDLYSKQITDSITTLRWEKLAPADTSEIEAIPRLTTARSVSLDLLKEVVSSSAAHEFYSAEPTVALPLTRFESGQYFNFETGQFEQPSAQQLKRLADGRAAYLKSLVNLENELRSMRARGETVSPQDVASAIKMSISEWAKIARASELYRHI